VSFQLRHEQHPNAFGKDPTTWVLEDNAGNRLDVWPALGFNAFRWTASGVDLLDCDPTFFQVQKPTRSGFPILFPFPNRIRDGRFDWQGQAFQLPLNDSTGKNAIHGFALNVAWTPSVALAADHAVLTGRFDFAPDKAQWPAPATLFVDYRLSVNGLQVTARIESHEAPLPFGLGYHQYFAISPFGGNAAIVTLAAEEMWELHDNLPSGKRVPLAADKDMRRGKAFGSLTLDDAYCHLTPRPAGDLGWIGGVRHPAQARALDMFVSPVFREIVAFTPPHRRAVCLEPYTCTTDAINLQARGIDAGWLDLPPHSNWEAIVRLQFTP
jgi:aldose 1-epimerase